MPKISNNHMSIYHKDIKKNYTIVVMYNQEYTFYAVIPPEFKEIVHHLSDTERKDLFIHKKYASKRGSHIVDAAYDAIISATTEGDCLSRMRKCIESLMDKAIQQCKVIILFYNPKDTMNYNEHKYNDQHPQIGLQMGLTYAVETSVGDKKVYSLYREYEAFGEKHVDRKELNLWNKAATIIPDTPENREALEYLYNALKLLNEKLTSFTATPEKLLEFIQSNVKLLN